MKVYSCPSEIPEPKYDWNSPSSSWEAAEASHSAALKAWLINRGYAGKDTGEIVRFPVADGYAQYMFGDKGAQSILIHLPYGDAYQYRHAQYLPRSEIMNNIQHSKNMAAFVAKKNSEKGVTESVPKNGIDMTGREASKMDKSYYEECDEDSGAYCVFGNNSGHAYASYATEEEAKKKADQMNSEKGITETSYSAKAARAGKDIGKPGKTFKKIEKKAAKEYGSEEAGEKVAGAVLNKLRHVNEQSQTHHTDNKWDVKDANGDDHHFEIGHNYNGPMTPTTDVILTHRSSKAKDRDMGQVHRIGRFTDDKLSDANAKAMNLADDIMAGKVQSRGISKFMENKTPRTGKISEMKKVKETKTVTNLAFLVESELDKAQVVLAAKSILDKLQKIAEGLSKIEADDIMPILDTMRLTFGGDVADKFNEVTVAQIRRTMDEVANAKQAIAGEVGRLEHMINGGTGTDMGMDDGMPDELAEPEGEVDATHDETDMGLGSETPDLDGAEDDRMADIDAAFDTAANNSAGRAHKESVQVNQNIKALKESKNPDKLIFETFRRTLRESNNAILSAKAVARAFAIDYSDVVDIIKEGKTWKDQKSDKRNTDWKAQRKQKRFERPTEVEEGDENCEEGKTFKDNKDNKKNNNDWKSQRKQKRFERPKEVDEDKCEPADKNCMPTSRVKNKPIHNATGVFNSNLAKKKVINTPKTEVEEETSDDSVKKPRRGDSAFTMQLMSKTKESN